MEKSVRDRLVIYLKYKGIGQNLFESQAGISRGYISHLKYSPGAEQLMKILNAAPDLNRVWLLTGEGSMLRTEDDKSNASEFVPDRAVKVAVVSSYAQAGYLSGYADTDGTFFC